jgi:dihydroorotate dehydrogenase (NAD+) catalytic subunit
VRFVTGLSVRIGGVKFENPVWLASGTCGWGDELKDYTDLERVGAIVTKTVTLNAREGNPPPESNRDRFGSAEFNRT